MNLVCHSLVSACDSKFCENPFFRDVVLLARNWMVLLGRAFCRTSDSYWRKTSLWQLQAAPSFFRYIMFYLKGGFRHSYREKLIAVVIAWGKYSLWGKKVCWIVNSYAGTIPECKWTGSRLSASFLRCIYVFLHKTYNNYATGICPSVS
jgi:hypothetical protein